MIDYIYFYGHGKENDLQEWSKNKKREDIISIIHISNDKGEEEIMVCYWDAN